MDRIFPLKLDFQGLLALSRAYMNKEDSASVFFERIQRIDGYEDILIHADKDRFVYEAIGGQDVFFTALELAQILKNDANGYNGNNIRLLSCGSGRSSDGLAQQLANELHVNVLAPSETLWIREDGNLFVSDNGVLADMWNDHIDVNETGEWRLFSPQTKEESI